MQRLWRQGRQQISTGAACPVWPSVRAFRERLGSQQNELGWLIRMCASKVKIWFADGFVLWQPKGDTHGEIEWPY